MAAHGNAAHDVVADLLGNLSDELLAVVFQLNGVEQVGQLTVLEADVQYRSDDLYDGSDVFFWHSIHSFRALSLRLASAPATISVISCVIAA